MLTEIRSFVSKLLLGPKTLEHDAQLLGLLSGSGIELGALHRPVKADHLKVNYVDRLSREDLLRQYPELQGQPIVETDILDDAEELRTIDDESQDFVIARHVIEHMRNPIKSLLNWVRVLKPRGKLYLVVPDKRATFDRDRALTPIDHLLLDFEDPSPDRDLEAFEEFALHASCREFGIRPEAEHRDVARELVEKDYSIHFHVWTDQSFREFLDYVMAHFEGFGARIVLAKRAREEFAFVLERSG